MVHNAPPLVKNPVADGEILSSPKRNLPLHAWKSVLAMPRNAIANRPCVHDNPIMPIRYPQATTSFHFQVLSAA
jgi:hypothetical protein